MKKIYAFLMIGFMFSLFSCENDEGLAIEKEDVIIKDIAIANQQTEKVTVSENGYLVFKDQESYSEILNNIDKMTDDEFTLWEKSIGFESAQTFLADFYEKLENVDTYEEYEILQQQFSDKLVFESDGSIRLNFYATAWDRVLNVDGVMKIGNTLHKFEKERQIIIRDGKYDDLADINLIVNDSSKVRVFYPNSEINNEYLKSLQWGVLESGTIATGSKNGDSRLQYSFQLISFNFTGYGASTIQYTEAGFQIRLRLDQQRKGLGFWRNNKTVYEFRNHSHHIEYTEPWKEVRVYYNWVYSHTRIEGGAHINSIESLPDYTSVRTDQGQRWTLYYFYFCDAGEWTHVEPQIHYMNFTFWSGGIGYNLRKTINYSNTH